MSAVATGWLTAFAVGAFSTDPIGSVTADEKVGHNVGLLVLVVAVGAVAVGRARAHPVRVSVAG